MTITWMLYLTNVVSNIDNILGLVFVAYLIIIGFVTFVCSVENEWDADKFSPAKLFKWLTGKLWAVVIGVILLAITPSKQTMYLMLGANYLESSDLPVKVSEALNLKLDDVLKELKDKK